MLTDLQKLKHRFIFDLLDIDKNGYIECGDFEEMAEKLCMVRGEEMDTAESATVLKKFTELWSGLEGYMDKDGDSKCSIEEWWQFIDKHLVNGDPTKGLSHLGNVVGCIFDLYDVNKDGSISISEYLDIFLSFDLNAGLVAKSFTTLDANSDDALSRDELIRAVSDYLISNDKNNTANMMFGDIFSVAV